MCKGKKLISFLACLFVVFAVVMYFSQSAEAAEADTFPSKPLTIVVPLTAGGAADRNARLAAGYLEQYVGVPVTVINLPSAGGIEAIRYLMDQQSDGHTLLTGNGSSVLSRMILQQSDYKGTDLKAVVNYTYVCSGLAVKADSPWNTLQDFLDYVKANPGEVTVGLAGEGSTGDVNTTAFCKLLGLEVTKVQYAGSGPACIAVGGGHVDATIASDGSIIPVLADGSIKVIATFGAVRTVGFPDAPTLLESGIDYASSSAHAFWVKKDTPQEYIDKLEEAFMKVLKDEEFLAAAKMIDLEVVPEASAPATEKLYKEWDELVEFFSQQQ